MVGQALGFLPPGLGVAAPAPRLRDSGINLS